MIWDYTREWYCATPPLPPPLLIDICDDLGDIRSAIEHYDKCLSLDPHSRNAGQNKLLAMNSLPDAGQCEVSTWFRMYVSYRIVPCLCHCHAILV